MSSEIAELITPIGTWALVIAGWYALHKTAVIRARRQEELARVADITKRIEEIRDKAIAYYMAGAEVPERAANQARLRYELQSLISRIQLLRKRRSKFYDLEAQRIELRKAVTGGEFESPNRVAAGPGSAVIQELWYSADSLIVALHEEFEKANEGR